MTYESASTATRSFRRAEDGAMSAAGIIFILIMLTVGGLALDYNKVIKTRTELQAGADATAHAALYLLASGAVSTPEAAKTEAIKVAQKMLPSWRNGTVLTTSDIEFGRWNRITRTFAPDSSSRTAVRVNTSRLASNANGVSTSLLHFAGVQSFDLRSEAVFETFQPPCMRQGFVSDKIIDLQSNNLFIEGFCLHANDHIEMNINNTFQNNVVVSMPNRLDVVTPSGNYTANPGLAEALRDASYSIAILNDLPAIIEDLRNGGYNHAPDYIDSYRVIENLRPGSLDPESFTGGKIHYVRCSGNQDLRLRANRLYSNFVLVTNCAVRFPAQAEFHDVTIATTNTDAASIQTAAKLVLGKDDDCAVGGGSVFMTLGGIRIAAQMEMNGSRMIALGGVTFTSLANGFHGASIIAGGDISGTTNMTFGVCPDEGLPTGHETPYFRMVL